MARTDLEIREEPIGRLDEHARVSIAFRVERVFDSVPAPDSPLGFDLVERVLDRPWTKDYDAEKGEGPTRWADRFDVSSWGLLAAYRDGVRTGGAVLAFRTPVLDLLEGRDDLAVLWDLRVGPEARGRGVGSALFRAAEAWAVARGCRALRVETQSVNVPAHRFYLRRGCRLVAIDPFAYPALPDEAMLLFEKELSPCRPGPDPSATKSGSRSVRRTST